MYMHSPLYKWKTLKTVHHFLFIHHNHGLFCVGCMKVCGYNMTKSDEVGVI